MVPLHSSVTNSMLENTSGTRYILDSEPKPYFAGCHMNKGIFYEVQTNIMYGARWLAGERVAWAGGNAHLSLEKGCKICCMILWLKIHRQMPFFCHSVPGQKSKMLLFCEPPASYQSTLIWSSLLFNTDAMHFFIFLRLQ